MSTLLPTTQRRLTSVNAAAEYAGVSSKTIRRMVSRGQLTGYRFGNRLIRIDADELNAILRPIPTAGGEPDAGAA